MSNKKGFSLSEIISNFLPITVFFLVFKLSNHPKPLIHATIALIIVTVIILIATYVVKKKFALAPLLSALILGIFGSLTIISNNEIFIKMKPTFVNSFLAIILFAGYFFNKPLLQYLFGRAMNLGHKAWLTLSLRWGWFFLFLAILNEVIWRNFSTSFWVSFKVFGIMPISALFAIANMPYIIREVEKNEKQKGKN